MINQAEQLQGFSTFANLATAFGSEIIPKSDLKMFDGIEELLGSLEEKPVPIIFQPIGAKQFNFAGNLQRNFIQYGLNELQGEATILGKIQQIVRKGEKVEIFNFLPDISALEGNNRKQRRKMNSGKGKKKYKDFKESIKGPAIILTPLAVYR